MCPWFWRFTKYEWGGYRDDGPQTKIPSTPMTLLVMLFWQSLAAVVLINVAGHTIIYLYSTYATFLVAFATWSDNETWRHLCRWIKQMWTSSDVNMARQEARNEGVQGDFISCIYSLSGDYGPTEFRFRFRCRKGRFLIFWHSIFRPKKDLCTVGIIYFSVYSWCFRP